jgi:RNA polymerase sigma factor (TIGR02999 family)
MLEPVETRITYLLEQLDRGNRGALDELFPLLYDELHAIAHRQRRRWQGDATMNTTALVHELYVKLDDQERLGTRGRAHFYALASKAMRHILSNYARKKRAKKRGGNSVKLPLEEAKLLAYDGITFSADQAELLTLLEDALNRMEQVDPRRALVVECRFYGGMTIPDTAAALEISPRTVKRDWAVAQAWLHREMKEHI